MSLTFRGCLWRHGPFLDLRTHSSSPSLILRRTFAQAAKPVSRLAKRTKPPPPSVRPSQAYLPPKTSYANGLAGRSSPTLLYQSPISTTYQLACVLTGTSAIAYGLYNLWDAFAVPHPGLVWFVPWLMAFVCAFMLGVGTFVLRNGTRLVQSVTAIPPSMSKSARVGRHSGDLIMRVELRSLVGRRRVLERPMRDVRIGDGLAEARVEGLGSRDVHAEMETFPATEAGRRAVQVTKKKMERVQRRETLGNPFTHFRGVVARVFTRLSRGIRRVVSREGFVDLDVRREDGGKWRTWRMDVSEGWLLDAGSPMERLLR